MKLRLVILSLGLFGLGALYLGALPDCPAVGQSLRPYAERVNEGVRPERHTQDAVTAVNFDYRGIDTLGEELILFVSVLGAVVLLREAWDKKGALRPDQALKRQIPPPSEPVAAWTVAMTGPTFLFGFYLVTHGQLSPGGGFQGGVVLATVPLLIYLADGFESFRKITSHESLESLEAWGVLIFLLVGLLGVMNSGAYLQNILPLGKTGDVFSSGTIFIINLATGLEVGSGFVLLLHAFLQTTLIRGKEK